MGYRALLFCPDEKTARAVTQVLTDLEFAVEPAAEPFAAVKKLMAEHFDAVVVDCDNEQNATLLFKSARNSTSNQSSLSVAVVEGQAGVAKAFRIGANLVLTRPINIEQAKGTLRVARGLLRKGDPAKGVAPGAAAAAGKPGAAAPASPAAAKPVQAPAVKPVAPVAPTPRPAAPSTPAISAKPSQAAAAAAHSASAAQDADLLELNLDDDSSADAAAAPVPQSAPSAVAKASKPPQSLSAAIAASQFGGGAASAPAPARSTQHEIPEAIAPSAPAEEPAPAFHQEESSSSYTGSAPSFSFGGANAEPSSGGSKKTLLIVAAAAIVLVALYVGWTQFHDKISSTPAAAPQQQAPAPAPSPSPTQSVAPKAAPATKPSTPAASSSTTPAPDATASEPIQDIQIGGNASGDSSDSTSEEPAAESHSGKTAGKNSTKASTASPTANKSASASKAESTPIVVKGNSTVHAKTAAPAPDASAPNISSIATTGGNGNLTNLISSSSQAPKPVLQTVNLSQGVSQGLLIKKVQPVYPASALRLRQEGSVQLLATISKSGTITAVKVISGPSVLAKAAQDAVKQWKYKPYFLNSEPVEVQTPITVNFKLPQ